MTITNHKEVARIKKLFFLVSIVIALVTLFIFLKSDFLYALIGIGVFSIWYLVFHLADYQTIEFSDEEKKVSLKYYKAISFGKKQYRSIEFPQMFLVKAKFENSLFGKLSDLTLEIKTKRGVAEYPSVSLAAVSKDDREKIQKSLNEMLKK